jgi:hypothetical protein
MLIIAIYYSKRVIRKSVCIFPLYFITLAVKIEGQTRRTYTGMLCRVWLEM